MTCAGCRKGSASGAVVGLVGLGLVGVGLWARRDVARTLARERIVSGPDASPVVSAGAARSLAEAIRMSTLEATGGRAYSETPSYLGPDGEPTNESALALMTTPPGSRSTTRTSGSGCRRPSCRPR